MDRDQDRFGWITLDVKDQKDDCPVARSMDGATMTVVTVRMPVLYVRWKVSCLNRDSCISRLTAGDALNF